MATELLAVIMLFDLFTIDNSLPPPRAVFWSMALTYSRCP